MRNAIEAKGLSMTVINVTTRDGAERELNGAGGHSLMEVIRAGGIDEVLALCGGCCSCATCHVYIDAAFLPLLPPMSQDEDDLLDSSDHRTAFSRLSCQVKCTAGIDGIRLRVAPED